MSSNDIVICDASSSASAVAVAAGGTPYFDGTYIFEWYDSSWVSIHVGDTISNLGIGDIF